MADTSTLQPLTRQQRRDLDPRADRDVITQARERFAWAADHETDERAQHLEALTFRAGDHWPVVLQQGQDGGQPPPMTMVIDRLNPMIQQVLNAYRRSPLAMRVRPKGGGAEKKVADIFEGKLRDIEQQSEADIAYFVALDQACGQGLGYFLLTTEYDDPHSFTQALRIKPIYNRFAVYVDPASTHPAGLDMEWAFIIERMATSRFQGYYEVSPQELTLFCGPEDGTWHTKAEVQVARYYYKTYKKETIVRLPDGRVLPTDGLTDLDPTWPTRETRVPTVHWVTMAGNAILERDTWLGCYVPIIRVEGQRLDVNGQAKRTGMIQAGRDAQMAIDVYTSMEAVAILAAPKAPYIVDIEQIAPYTDLWNRANDPLLPYLPYKPTVHGGQLLPPPQRQSIEPAINAITQAKVLAQQDLQATLGLFDASMGAPSNERSGVAIEQRKIEGEGTNYGYTANLGWSIRALGTMCVEILPKLHSGPAVLRQVGPDGTVKTTPVNQPYQDEQGQVQQHMLGQGQYEVVLSSGPSYETARQQVSDKLGTVIGAVPPETQAYFLDVWAGSLDFPGSEDLAARLKTLVPPAALAASEQTDPKTQLVTMQNQLKQATEALQMMQQQLQQSQELSEVSKQQVALLEQQVAVMQARLADKQQENQLTMQKNQMDYEIDRQKLLLEEHKLVMTFQQSQQSQNGTEDAG